LIEPVSCYEVAKLLYSYEDIVLGAGNIQFSNTMIGLESRPKW